MPADIFVSVTNPSPLDQGLFLKWLKGCSAEYLVKEETLSMMGMDSDLVRNYVFTQYRNFEMLRHFLHHPVHFPYQPFFPFPKEIFSFLIEKFYQFDEVVMRFLLGKKLNSRLKKDLDELSDSSGISLSSCRRQFDNLKRISKSIEDVDNIPQIEYIMQHFLLSRELAEQYTRILFIAENRLDTSRRRLEPYSFLDFDYCAWAMMSYWTRTSISFVGSFANMSINPGVYPTASNSIGNILHAQRINSSTERNFGMQSRGQYEFDVRFVQALRDIRTFFINRRDSFDTYCQYIQHHAERIQKTDSDVEVKHNTVMLGNAHRNMTVFKSLIKNILGIGASLLQSKEFRDIFIDIVEKIIDPCKEEGKWTSDEVELFFVCAVKGFSQLLSEQEIAESDLERNSYLEVYEEYITGLMLCVIRFY